jgi:hypothetical protein
MADSKRSLGPWRDEQFLNLLTLLKEIKSRPRTVNALLELGLSQLPGGKLKNETADCDAVRLDRERLERDPAYQALARDQHFCKATKVFRKRLAKASERADDPRAEFGFIESFVHHAGYYFARKSGLLQSPAAHSKTRQKALSAIASLRRARQSGARLRDAAVDSQLDDSLGQLEAELRAVKIKRYETLRSLDRDAIASLSRTLMVEFGFSSPTLLGHFVDFIGSDLDVDTVKKCGRQAARQCRAGFQAALANALLKP